MSSNLDISRVQRDLAEMRERINKLSLAQPREDLAKAVARLVAASRGPMESERRESRPTNEPVRLIEPATKPAAVAAAISYAKHLRGRNRNCVSVAGSAGRKLYEQTLAQLRKEAREQGVVLLGDECSAVIRRLERMEGGGVIRLHAPIQKFMDGKTRAIRGFASTSQVDREGDVVVPSGMQVTLPVPLLWQHDAKQPIGSVRTAEVRGEGVWIEASLVTGVARADEAWTLIEGGAIDSFSIGFRGLKSEPIATGFRYTSWELLETSLVSIPANPGAKLRRYK
jgi:HK97 family phage prohead protease